MKMSSLRSEDCICLTVDMHRGHLDPSVATMPLPAEAAERVVNANQFLLENLRSIGVPVLHAIAEFNDLDEVISNPVWRQMRNKDDCTRKNVRHNIKGMPGCELMPDLMGPQDLVIANKKRYSSFIATELEFILRTTGRKTLIITGINTNSCVLATAVDACSRDFFPIVISDCSDTIDGLEYHEWGLKIIGTAFGLVMNTEELLASFRTG